MPTILALHGWLDNLETFHTLAPRLCHRFHVITVDLPGHGQSQHTKNHEYAFSHWPLYLKEIIETLGIKKPILLGHSMGAAIVTMFAGIYPDIPEKIISIDGLGPLSHPASESPRRLRAYISFMEKFTRNQTRPYLSIEEALQVRQSISPLPEAGAKAIIERNLTARDSRFFWRTDKSLTIPSPVRLDEEQIKAFLSEITCPVLHFRPDRGFPVDEGALRRRYNCVESLELIEPKGRHHVHLETPEKIAQHILEFLGSPLHS